VLSISKCSMVLAKPNDTTGVVVAAYENRFCATCRSSWRAIRNPARARHRRVVLVAGRVHANLYEQERVALGARGIKVPTRSAVALPFSMKDQQVGVFFLRTTGDDPALTPADAQFAET